MSKIVNKLIIEGFIKICVIGRGCEYHHPDGRRVKVFGNRIIHLTR